VTGAASGRVEVMLTATGEVQVPEAGHRDGVGTLEVSPDGQLVLSTSHDGSVRLV
jgi:WD40 repeat protein